MKATRIVQLLTLTAGLTATTGCTTTASIVKSLAKDPASWQIHVVTPWGTADYVRTGWSCVTNNQNEPVMVPTFQERKK
jgi:hypothetical protein